MTPESFYHGVDWHLNVDSLHPKVEGLKGFDCSSIQVVHELGLERYKIARFVSTIGITGRIVKRKLLYKRTGLIQPKMYWLLCQ